MTVIESSPVVTPIEVAEPNEVQRILLEARDVIADPRNWTRWGLYSSGRVCAIGAVARVLGWQEVGEAIYERFNRCPASPFLAAAAAEVYGMSETVARSRSRMVFDLNDLRGHTAVMCMFNRAIELAA